MDEAGNKGVNIKLLSRCKIPNDVVLNCLVFISVYGLSLTCSHRIVKKTSYFTRHKSTELGSPDCTRSQHQGIQLVSLNVQAIVKC